MNTRQTSTMMRTAAAVAMLARVAVAQPNGDAPAQSTPAQSTPAQTAPAMRTFDDVGSLLTELEAAGDRLDRLFTKVYYERENDLVGEIQVRTGTLHYDRRLGVTAPPPGENTEAGPGVESGSGVETVEFKRFAIGFDSLTVFDEFMEEGTRDPNYRQTYIFDGEWLTEIQPIDKQFTKRQVVPPGERFDPLRVGEGPFPVPLGQKKADILKRFDAEIVGPTDGLGDSRTETQMRAMAEARCVQLRLVPKAGTDEADEFEEVRVWYDRGRADLLPVMARTVAVDGDIATVLLTGFVVNGPEFAAEVFDTEPPSRQDGWAVHIEGFRG